MLNQKGMAIFEIIPILGVFILLLNFSIGFFGAIHSGILNSIASRNYAFETFRNRSNLNYFRDSDNKEGPYLPIGYRYHTTVAEGGGKEETFYATRRALKLSNALSPVDDESEVHTSSQKVGGIKRDIAASEKIDQDEFGSIWVRTAYGICLNNGCGR